MTLLLWTALVFASPPEALVEIRTLSPHVRLDIRYATESNFTKHVVYPVARCYLVRPVAEALAAVQTELEKDGLGLQVFDCYRPTSVQRRFWALVPDARYVANPQKGSRHNRGAAVDLTLVDAHGQPLPMPSEFDDFSERAHRDFTGASPAALANRARLEQVMTRHGFVGMPTEWWHFDAATWKSYPLLDVDFAALPAPAISAPTN